MSNVNILYLKNLNVSDDLAEMLAQGEQNLNHALAMVEDFWVSPVHEAKFACDILASHIYGCILSCSSRAIVMGLAPCLPVVPFSQGNY